MGQDLQHDGGYGRQYIDTDCDNFDIFSAWSNSDMDDERELHIQDDPRDDRRSESETEVASPDLVFHCNIKGFKASHEMLPEEINPDGFSLCSDLDEECNDDNGCPPLVEDDYETDQGDHDDAGDILFPEEKF